MATVSPTRLYLLRMKQTTCYLTASKVQYELAPSLSLLLYTVSSLILALMRFCRKGDVLVHETWQ
jgi:hypothetical protein